MDIKNKIKEVIKDNSTPITAEKARMIAFTGCIITPEQRFKNFLSEINKNIECKTRCSAFYQMVEIPEDLMSERKTILESFTERGFTIYEVTPANKEIFIIGWKYGK